MRRSPSVRTAPKNCYNEFSEVGVSLEYSPSIRPLIQKIWNDSVRGEQYRTPMSLPPTGSLKEGWPLLATPLLLLPRPSTSPVTLLPVEQSSRSLTHTPEGGYWL